MSDIRKIIFTLYDSGKSELLAEWVSNPEAFTESQNWGEVDPPLSGFFLFLGEVYFSRGQITWECGETLPHKQFKNSAGTDKKIHCKGEPFRSSG